MPVVRAAEKSVLVRDGVPLTQFVLHSPREFSASFRPSDRRLDRSISCLVLVSTLSELVPEFITDGQRTRIDATPGRARRSFPHRVREVVHHDVEMAHSLIIGQPRR